MLAAAYRLKDRQEFEEVKSKGRVYQGKYFGLAVFKRGDKKPSRYGFVVSNKISGKAPLRSKAKRALREGVRQSMTYVKPGYNIVFLTKQSILKSYTTDVMKEVYQSLKKAKLIKVVS